jgi:hypothetical protein
VLGARDQPIAYEFAERAAEHLGRGAEALPLERVVPPLAVDEVVGNPSFHRSRVTPAAASRRATTSLSAPRALDLEHRLPRDHAVWAHDLLPEEPGGRARSGNAARDDRPSRRARPIVRVTDRRQPSVSVEAGLRRTAV